MTTFKRLGDSDELRLKRALLDQFGGEAVGVITRVAGTGTQGYRGDDGPATEAEFYNPLGVAVTADGGFLIADTNNHVVRKVSSAGVITRVAGTGTDGNSGDDGPATEAELSGPIGVAVTADGGFLIADSGNYVVRKVSSAGVITRVAGTGTPGNSGDDGPATEAELSGPLGVAVTADGGFLITDPPSYVVRKVSSAGVITRVAGTGTEGYSGDDGPATEAELSGPYGVAVTADGGFLIVDTGVGSLGASNHMVRKVSSAGVITRVAGTGTDGNSGDDGPATEAELSGPIGVAVTPDGGFLITDIRSCEVRKVSSADVITRVAGTGTPGNSGDDGPATEAELSYPYAVSVTPDGGFLITDSNVVRKVALADET
jgi:NHL repeat